VRCEAKHIDGFPVTYVVQSSTADAFDEAEKWLPLVGNNAASVTDVSDQY